MKWILIEKLHRYVFDVIYNQKHKITITDKAVLWFYKRTTKKNHDWRYNLSRHIKSFNRYSGVSRINSE